VEYELPLFGRLLPRKPSRVNLILNLEIKSYKISYMRNFVANSTGRPKQKALENTENIMFLLKKNT
jgi:hypothetical protein